MEAFLHAEAGLHHGVAAHAQDLLLAEVRHLVVVFDLDLIMIGASFSSLVLLYAIFDLLDSESNLRLAVLDRGDKDLTHCVLKLNLDHSLEISNRLCELFRNLHLLISFLVVSQFAACLLILLLDLFLLGLNDQFSLILTIDLVVGHILDELVEGQFVLLAQIDQSSRFAELELEKPLLEAFLLTLVAHLENSQLCVVALVEAFLHLF